MRSVTIHGTGLVSVDTVPDPVLPGPDGAIVEVTTTAICGSDLHFYDGDLPFYPVAVGHEVVGRVVEAGPDVRRVKLGDRVLVASVAGCGGRDGCATGDPVPCVAGGQIFGSGTGLGGGQSDLVPLITQGRLDTRGIFTHTYALDDAAPAYTAVAARSAEVLKVRFTL